LKYAGAFSVSKNTKDILLSLDYAAKLLDDPKNLVLIFPQGQLYPNFTMHIHFEKGVQRIINQAQGKFQLVFAAAFIQYFKHIKPTATVYLKTESVIYAGKSKVRTNFKCFILRIIIQDKHFVIFIILCLDRP